MNERLPLTLSFFAGITVSAGTNMFTALQREYLWWRFSSMVLFLLSGIFFLISSYRAQSALDDCRELFGKAAKTLWLSEARHLFGWVGYLFVFLAGLAALVAIAILFTVTLSVQSGVTR